MRSLRSSDRDRRLTESIMRWLVLCFAFIGPAGCGGGGGGTMPAPSGVAAKPAFQLRDAVFITRRPALGLGFWLVLPRTVGTVQAFSSIAFLSDS